MCTFFLHCFSKLPFCLTSSFHSLLYVPRVVLAQHIHCNPFLRWIYRNGFLAMVWALCVNTENCEDSSSFAPWRGAPKRLSAFTALCPWVQSLSLASAHIPVSRVSCSIVWENAAANQPTSIYSKLSSYADTRATARSNPFNVLLLIQHQLNASTALNP
jgi:hypothetical protein